MGNYEKKKKNHLIIILCVFMTDGLQLKQDAKYMRQELESKESMIAELLSDVSSITRSSKTILLLLLGGELLSWAKRKKKSTLNLWEMECSCRMYWDIGINE